MIKAETTHDEARVDERPQATVLERAERSREKPRDQTSRRKMLVRAAAGLAAAGALLEARGAAAQAATGSPFILGVANDASTTTELGPTPGFSPNPALQIDAGGAATAVKGTSSGGFGTIRAENAGAGPGVVGTSVGNVGVTGLGGTGVEGHTTVSGGIGVGGIGFPGGTGVNGISDTGVGVAGDSTSGIGANGNSSGAGNTGTDPTPSTAGVGVRGRNDDPSGIGVEGTAGLIGVKGASSSGTGVFGVSTDGIGAIGRTSSSNGRPAVLGNNLGTGPGVQGNGVGGGNGVIGTTFTAASAVFGTNSQGGIGVEGLSTDFIGVKGSTSSANPGVLGTNAGSGAGVQGGSTSGPGVLGQSNSGTAAGVDGRNATPFGVGVRGRAEVASATGVRAENPFNGFALRALGKAQFSTAGSGTIAAGSDAATVANPNVTANSHITATLVGDPRSKTTVMWVDRSPGVGFTVHLILPVKVNTAFTFLIVEP